MGRSRTSDCGPGKRDISADATAQARKAILDARKLQHAEDEWALGSAFLQDAIAILKSPKYRQKVNTATGVAEIVPVKFTRRDAAFAAGMFMKLRRASAQMPLSVSEDATQVVEDSMYETSGQLATELPPGAVPVMPVDTFAKPDLAASVQSMGDLKRPDPRSRERPDN